MKPWELLASERPSRYIGGEIGSVRKEPADAEVRFGLCFPDTYEIGMSHLGMKILYHRLNGLEWCYAERVFIPWIDRMDAMSAAGDRLCTMETETPLAQLDVLGVSLLYELSYTNALAMLSLAGLPLRSDQRGEDAPLVIGGGATVFNPEPVADFFDAFLLGDGEEAIEEIAETVRRGKRDGVDKQTLLRRLSAVEGIYVPSYYRPEYDANGRLAAMKPIGDAQPRVRRRFLADLDSVPYPTDPAIPFAQAVHDRIGIEVSRGCTQGCRYCQAGYTYRPVRERRPETIKKIIRDSIANTGYETLSLLSLSVGDHSCISDVVKKSLEECLPTRTAMGLPSLRVGTVGQTDLEAVGQTRATGITLVPEAGSQRLRDVINKRITEKEILDNAAAAFRAGRKGIKLYFMIGLPSETDEDIEAIIDLAGKIRRTTDRRRADISVSVSTFVPKSHTPFQWSPQISLEESREKIERLKRGVRKLGLRLKWQSPELSWLEGAFSRSDRRLGAALEAAHRLGCRMDGWGDQADIDKWRQAFQEAEIDPDAEMTRPREREETFAWDHLDSGVEKQFLWDDFEAALQGHEMEDCFTENCTDCGVCDFDEIKNRSAEEMESSPAPQPIQPAQTSEEAQPSGGGWVRPARKENAPPVGFKYRLAFEKTDRMRFLSHLEMASVFHRAFRRVECPVKYSEGFHPSPKINFSNPLPTGVASLDEYCDIETVERINPIALTESLNAAMPEGIRIREVQLFPARKGSLMKNFAGATYRAGLEALTQLPDRDKRFLSERLESYNASEAFPAVKTRPGKPEKTVDLKQSVTRIEFEESDALKFTARFIEGGISNPFQILAAALGLTREESHRLDLCKTETLMR